MSKLICAKCNTQSPENSFYCQQCGQPLLCKNCKALLLPTARACVECGRLIPERSNNEQFYAEVASTTPPGYSHLKMHETPDVRDFDLLVANDAIEHIRDLFPLLVGNRPSGQSKSSMDYEVQARTDLVDVTSSEIPSAQPQLIAASVPLSTSPEGIWVIFRNHEGKLTQEKADLKAINKKDYVMRLALLYMYARHLSGDEKVPRDDVFKILDKAGVKDTHCSTYIRDAGIRPDENETLRITLDGQDKAQKYVTETLDTNAPAGWRESSESRSANNSTKKSAKKASKDTVVASWTSHEKTKELVATFPHATIDTMTVTDRALFALYCFSKIGIETEVQQSQIAQYLYLAFQIKVLATSLPKSLNKVIERKPAYATFRKGSGYRITSSGIDYIEQLLKLNK